MAHNCGQTEHHHHHRDRPGACCPFHATVGMAVPSAGGDDSAEPVSLLDMTPKETSGHCSADRSPTAGLFEPVGDGQAVVFRNARVLTMRDGAVLDHHDVLVRDRLIAGVAPTGSPLPEGARVVDCTGKTLMPGFSEIHAHIFTVNWAQAYAPMVDNGGDCSAYVLPYDLMLFQLLANGITRVEIMAGCPETLWMRDSVRSGTLVGPRFSVGSPLVDGAPLMHSPLMSFVVGDRAGGERAGDIIAEMGYDFAKPYSRLPAEGYHGLMDALDRHGIRAMGHVPEKVGIPAAVARGQGGIAHAAELFYNETGPERASEQRMARLAAIMAEAGTWLQATLVVVQRTADEFANLDRSHPDIAYMNPLQRALWAEDSPLFMSIKGSPNMDQYFSRAYELGCVATRLAHQAGVRVLTGTDFPNPFVIEGFALHDEFHMLVEGAGMTRGEVLFATTRQAAIYHGGHSADGMVAKGGIADLVVLDTDPLADITATRQIDTVLVDGRSLLSRAAIEEGLTRIRQRYAAMPPANVVMPGAGEHSDG
ncbi:amidohydrolase family protein [Sphingosinicella microcystinivorans]|uniref:Amidohydrolase family protein n=1 Tax=Sphingosinicella microcystinivorans TaxID=335406 RepID=A0ABX9SZD3_SPHMI|nr:amidohydrolase family protein [Sphingosinicella microcystinivorans]RKS89287.1 amidohydrolase family protein [Sphingosinicella microcystinivorans]